MPDSGRPSRAGGSVAGASVAGDSVAGASVTGGSVGACVGSSNGGLVAGTGVVGEHAAISRDNANAHAIPLNKRLMVRAFAFMVILLLSDETLMIRIQPMHH